MRALWAASGLLLMLCAVDARAKNLIAVLPLDVRLTKGRMDDAARASLEETLRDVAANSLAAAGWTVLSGETMIQLLQDNDVDLGKCGEESCHLATAKQFKVHKFISGTVQFVEGEFTASIRLIDTATGRIDASERLEGKTVSSLRKQFQSRAGELLVRGGMLAPASPPPDRSSEKSSNAQAPDTADNRPTISRGKVTEVFGKLTIATRPRDGVRLELTDPSGKSVVSGSPYENSRALPGAWKVLAKAAGFEEDQRTIDVAPDDFTLVKLELRELGGLSIEGEPAGAAVSVAGPGGFKDEGGLPWAAAGIRSGSYDIRTMRPGYDDDLRTIEVMPGKTTSARIVLTRTAGTSKTIQSRSQPNDTVAPRRARETAVRTADQATSEEEAADTLLGDQGTIIISSAPRGAELFVDGERLGTTPLKATVAPGKHIVSFRLAGYESTQKTVQIQGGEQNEPLVVKLSPAEGVLYLLANTDVSCVLGSHDITLDGGRTQSVRVPAGSLQLQCDSKGFESYAAVVEIKPGAAATLKIVMKERSSKKSDETDTGAGWRIALGGSLALAGAVGVAAMSSDNAKSRFGPTTATYLLGSSLAVVGLGGTLFKLGWDRLNSPQAAGAGDGAGGLPRAVFIEATGSF